MNSEIEMSSRNIVKNVKNIGTSIPQSTVVRLMRNKPKGEEKANKIERTEKSIFKRARKAYFEKNIKKVKKVISKHNLPSKKEAVKE